MEISNINALQQSLQHVKFSGDNSDIAKGSQNKPLGGDASTAGSKPVAKKAAAPATAEAAKAAAPESKPAPRKVRIMTREQENRARRRNLAQQQAAAVNTLYNAHDWSKLSGCPDISSDVIAMERTGRALTTPAAVRRTLENRLASGLKRRLARLEAKHSDAGRAERLKKLDQKAGDVTNRLAKLKLDITAQTTRIAELEAQATAQTPDSPSNVGRRRTRLFAFTKYGLSGTSAPMKSELALEQERAAAELQKLEAQKARLEKQHGKLAERQETLRTAYTDAQLQGAPYNAPRELMMMHSLVTHSLGNEKLAKLPEGVLTAVVDVLGPKLKTPSLAKPGTTPYSDALERHQQDLALMALLGDSDPIRNTAKSLERHAAFNDRMRKLGYDTTLLSDIDPRQPILDARKLEEEAVAAVANAEKIERAFAAERAKLEPLHQQALSAVNEAKLAGDTAARYDQYPEVRLFAAEANAAATERQNERLKQEASIASYATQNAAAQKKATEARSAAVAQTAQADRLKREPLKAWARRIEREALLSGAKHFGDHVKAEVKRLGLPENQHEALLLMLYDIRKTLPATVTGKDLEAFKPWAEGITTQLQHSPLVKLERVLTDEAKRLAKLGVELRPDQLKDLYEGTVSGTLREDELEMFKGALVHYGIRNAAKSQETGLPMAFVLDRYKDATLVSLGEGVLSRTQGQPPAKRLAEAKTALQAFTQQHNLAPGIISPTALLKVAYSKTKASPSGIPGSLLATGDTRKLFFFHKPTSKFSYQGLLKSLKDAQTALKAKIEVLKTDKKAALDADEILAPLQQKVDEAKAAIATYDKRLIELASKHGGQLRTLQQDVTIIQAAELEGGKQLIQRRIALWNQQTGRQDTLHSLRAMGLLPKNGKPDYRVLEDWAANASERVTAWYKHTGAKEGGNRAVLQSDAEILAARGITVDPMQLVLVKSATEMSRYSAPDTDKIQDPAQQVKKRPHRVALALAPKAGEPGFIGPLLPTSAQVTTPAAATEQAVKAAETVPAAPAPSLFETMILTPGYADGAGQFSITTADSGITTQAETLLPPPSKPVEGNPFSIGDVSNGNVAFVSTPRHYPNPDAADSSSVNIGNLGSFVASTTDPVNLPAPTETPPTAIVETPPVAAAVSDDATSAPSGGSDTMDAQDAQPNAPATTASNDTVAIAASAGNDTVVTSAPAAVEAKAEAPASTASSPLDDPASPEAQLLSNFMGQVRQGSTQPASPLTQATVTVVDPPEAAASAPATESTPTGNAGGNEAQLLTEPLSPQALAAILGEDQEVPPRSKK